ncbi:hypothetical protein BACCELL_00495 [Bacteroides cellulosilyticus DSM 14838]|uniref:Uncharacterized protein n=1 Tax=Bacteroides cellulosilyticus DSM 14838 TaxID=537012 RepID=E2N8A0_9BACE|nr:hypothetical protein BACCELL_00495 [Bacteroides cellulosilyticus DSM 14838]
MFLNFFANAFPSFQIKCYFCTFDCIYMKVYRQSLIFICQIVKT